MSAYAQGSIQAPSDVQSADQRAAEVFGHWCAHSPVLLGLEYLTDLSSRILDQASPDTVESITAALAQLASERALALPNILGEGSNRDHGVTEGAIKSIELILVFSEAFEAAKILHSVEVLSCSQMSEFTKWVEELHSISEKLRYEAVKEITGEDPRHDEISCSLMKLVDNLSICRIESSIRFTPGLEHSPEAGDILFLDSKKIVFTQNPSVSLSDEGHLILSGPGLSFDLADTEAKVESELCVTILNHHVAQRGEDAWLLPPYTPASSFSPYRPGVLLERDIGYEFEPLTDTIRCQILSLSGDRALVLWAGGGTSSNVQEVRLNSQGLLGFRLSYPHNNESSFAALPVDGINIEKNRFTKFLSPPLKGEPSVLKEHPAIDIRGLCEGLLKAELPILLRSWGMNRFEDFYEQLESQTICGLNRETITRDTEALLAYGACPVFIIAASDPAIPLLPSIRALLDLGWKVVIWNNQENQRDIILQDAIRDLYENREEGLWIISGSPEFLQAKVCEIGKTHEESLARPVERAFYPRPAVRKSLSYMTEQLFRISDAQVSENTPTRIRISTDLLSLCREAALAAPKEQGAQLEKAFAFGNELNYRDVRGRTRLESELSWYDFIEISGALARSRLPINHPAVALRGITCGDLSPRALESEYVWGANFYTVRAPDGTIDGVAITYSPSVLDSKWPGLSELLGSPGKTGYLFWMSVNPGQDCYSGMVYSKIVSAFLLEQVLQGADLASAVILERNLPSLTAAFAVAGFTTTPHTIEIGGERLIRVVCDLRELDTHTVRNSFREALTLSSEIFTGVQSGDTETGSKRIRQTVHYIDKILALKTAWAHVSEVLSVTSRFSPLDRAIGEVSEALKDLGDAIDWRMRSECILCLREVLSEGTRVGGVERFAELMTMISPESMKELEKTKRKLLERASAEYPETSSRNPPSNPFLFKPEEYPLKSEITEPRPVDFDEISRLNSELSSSYRQSLLHVRAMYESYVVALSLYRENNSDRIEAYGASRRLLNEILVEGSDLFPDLDRLLPGVELTEADRAHADMLRAYLSFGRQHLLGDTYSIEVSSKVIPVVNALVDCEYVFR